MDNLAQAAKPSDLSTITPNPNTTMPPKGTLHASLPGTGPTGPDGTPIVAPRRFKSAFIMFSSVRHKEIKKELAEEGIAKKTTDIAKMVSHEWRTMEPTKKAVWEEQSRVDKERYEAEKAQYKIASGKGFSRRILKDPAAPKRPMSAFLAFSNARRADLKKKNPSASNADLSKMLSKKWKEAPPESKQGYVENEARLRKKYKSDITTWRRKKAAENKSLRRKQEAAAVKAMQEREVRVAVAKRLSEEQQSDQQQPSAGQGVMGSSLLNSFGNPQLGGGIGGLGDASGLAAGNFMGMPGFMLPGGAGGAGAGNVLLQQQMARNAAAQQLLAQQLLAGQQLMPQQAFLSLQGQGLPNTGGNQALLAPFMQQQQGAPAGAPGLQQQQQQQQGDAKKGETTGIANAEEEAAA